jgi:hypothetical protein
MLDIDAFYAVDIHRDEIKLQGRWNSGLVGEMRKIKFKPDVERMADESSNPYYYMRRGNIVLILT